MKIFNIPSTPPSISAGGDGPFSFAISSRPLKASQGQLEARRSAKPSGDLSPPGDQSPSSKLQAHLLQECSLRPRGPVRSRPSKARRGWPSGVERAETSTQEPGIGEPGVKAEQSTAPSSMPRPRVRPARERAQRKTPAKAPGPIAFPRPCSRRCSRFLRGPHSARMAQILKEG